MEGHELSWFAKLKKSLKLDTLFQKLDLSRAKLIEMAVFLAIGFLIGILWRKYSNYLIAGFVFIGLLLFLQHLEVINVFINWPVIQDFCGLDVHQGDIGGALWCWCKAHFLSLGALGIGVVIGLKVS